MTDDERRMEDMMLGKHLGKDKGTIKFMQKYYHKGAFYMVSRDPPTLDWRRSGCTSDNEQHLLMRDFAYLEVPLGKSSPK